MSPKERSNIVRMHGKYLRISSSSGIEGRNKVNSESHDPSMIILA